MDWIDLRSDTVTQPTPDMRRAMAQAEVGDDVYGEDPTINELEARAAEMMGKEAALFVASGTMGNQLAVMAHTDGRGEEIILEEESHIFMYEGGGVALLAGCQTKTIPGVQGRLDPQAVEAALRPDNIHFPRTRLLCLENTHNRAGGTVLTVAQTEALAAVAHRAGVLVHLDGARVFNAAVALGVPVEQVVAPVDTVQFCLSKGLCAPVGSLVAGPRAFIEEGRRIRKVLGGGMRQAGILAAAGLIGLTEMVDRLAEDHDNARTLAEALTEIPGLSVNLDTVQSNIVAVDVDAASGTALQWLEDLAPHRIRANMVTPQRFRMVTHYGITVDDITRTIDAVREVSRGRV